MKRNITKRLRVWAIVVAGILMIPLLAKAPWTGGDFIFAGSVLFGLATIYEFATKNMSNKRNRIFAAIGVLAVLVLIQAWAVA